MPTSRHAAALAVPLVALATLAAPNVTRPAEASVNLWRPAAAGPPARFGAQMAYDANRGVTVLFGGCAQYVVHDIRVRFQPRQQTVVEEHDDEVLVRDHGWCRASDQFADTWIWNGATETWTQVTPSGPVPHARFYGSMAYDYRSRSVVLFGGIFQTSGTTTPDPADADLCFQDSEQPRSLVDQVVEDEGPPMRAVASVHREGTTTQFRYYCFKDTWRLVRDGAGAWSWQRLATAGTPPSRFSAGMAYDGSGRPTLVGGCHRLGMLGAHAVDAWKPVYWGCAEHAAISATYGDGCGVAGQYSEACGTTEVLHSDTWQLRWTGDPDAGGTPGWVQVGCLTPPHFTRPPCAPPVHDGAAVTFDPVSRRVFFFGGYWYEPVREYGGYQGDTWFFDGTAWRRALREGKQDQWGPSVNPFTAWAVATPVRVGGAWRVLHQGGKGRYFTTRTSCPPDRTDPPRSTALDVWDDTWTWNDAVCDLPSDGDRNCWSKLADGNPGPHYYASAAFDHVNGKVLLFGGLTCFTCLAGSAATWVYPAGAAPDPCGPAC